MSTHLLSMEDLSKFPNLCSRSAVLQREKMLPSVETMTAIQCSVLLLLLYSFTFEYMATSGFHCIGTGCNWKMSLEMSAQPPLTKVVANG